MVEVPTDGLLDAFLELKRGLPAELALQLSGVDGIAEIMTGTVGDVGDEVQRVALGVAQQAVDGLDDDVDNVDILPLIEAADIVGLVDLALVEDEVDSTGVVLYIEPVAHVLALAIHGKGLALTDVVDEEGDELLGELIRAIVIRTVCHYCRHTIRIMVSTYEVVATGLGGGIG